MGKLTQTISRDYRSLDENALASHALKIGVALPDILELPKIEPTPAQGVALVEQSMKAIASAPNGGSVAVARKNQLKQQVLTLLDDWTAYTLAALPDNPMLWLRAGFKLTKDASVPAQPLPAPTRFATAEGSSKGSVRVSQNAQPGTKAYVTEYALVPAEGKEPVWQYSLCSKSECELADLLSKTEYMFRGGAWNGTTRPAFSAVETRVVQ